MFTWLQLYPKSFLPTFLYTNFFPIRYEKSWATRFSEERGISELNLKLYSRIEFFFTFSMQTMSLWKIKNMVGCTIWKLSTLQWLFHTLFLKMSASLWIIGIIKKARGFLQKKHNYVSQLCPVKNKKRFQNYSIRKQRLRDRPKDR